MSDKEDIISDEKNKKTENAVPDTNMDKQTDTPKTEEDNGIKTTFKVLDEDKFDFFDIPSIHMPVSEQRAKELDHLDTILNTPSRNVPVLKVTRKEEALLLLGLYQYYKNNETHFYTVSSDNFEINNDNNYNKDDDIKEGADAVAIKRPDIPVHLGINEYIDNNVLYYFINHFLPFDLPAVMVVERNHWPSFEKELKFAYTKISGLDNTYEPYDYAGLARSAPLDVTPLTRQERYSYFQGYLDLYATEKQIIIPRSVQRYLINRSESQFKYQDIFLKLFDVLEHCTAEISKQGENKITQKLVSQVFKRYFPVHNPVKALADMDIRLKKKIFGQDHAIDTAYETILSHLDGETRTKPTVLAFFGPSGVGKTALAEEISLAVTGEKVSCINMAEYSVSFRSSILTGSAKGYVNSDEDGLLASIVKKNPNAVILLDEFEKADSQVQKLFLGIFDKGIVFDNNSGNIDMSKTTIILTSNAGVKTEKNIGFSSDTKPKFVADDELIKHSFPAELLGRIDARIIFNPLTKESMLKIVDKFMQQLNPRFKQLGVQVSLSENARNELVEKGQDPQTGARPLMTLLRQKVKTPIEIGVLKKRIKSGSRVLITSIQDKKMRILPFSKRRKQSLKKQPQRTR